jgi:hypothetical protein
VYVLKFKTGKNVNQGNFISTIHLLYHEANVTFWLRYYIMNHPVYILFYVMICFQS